MCRVKLKRISKGSTILECHLFPFGCGRSRVEPTKNSVEQVVLEDFAPFGATGDSGRRGMARIQFMSCETVLLGSWMIGSGARPEHTPDATQSPSNENSAADATAWLRHSGRAWQCRSRHFLRYISRYIPSTAGRSAIPRCKNGALHRRHIRGDTVPSFDRRRFSRLSSIDRPSPCAVRRDVTIAWPADLPIWVVSGTRLDGSAPYLLRFAHTIAGRVFWISHPQTDRKPPPNSPRDASPISPRSTLPLLFHVEHRSPFRGIDREGRPGAVMASSSTLARTTS